MRNQLHISKISNVNTQKHHKLYHLYLLLPFQGQGGLLDPIPAVFGPKAWLQPGQVTSVSQDHIYEEPHALTITAMDNFRITSQSNMFLDWEETGYPEKAYKQYTKDTSLTFNVKRSISGG